MARETGRTLALALGALVALSAERALAHPLGNFSINHHARIRVETTSVSIRSVLDFAELATFQAITTATGRASTAWSPAERDAYRGLAAARYVAGLALRVDGRPVPLRLGTSTISTLDGVAGQPTLRLEIEIEGETGAYPDGARFRFENANHDGRIGWREIVVTAGDGVAVFDSSAYATSLSDELRRYPEELLISPLDERRAEWSATSGALPAGATPLAPRSFASSPRSGAIERVAQLVAASPPLALIGILLAMALGGAEAHADRSAASPRSVALADGVRCAIGLLSDMMPVALVAWLVAEHLVPVSWRSALRVMAGVTIMAIGILLLSGVVRESVAEDPNGDRPWRIGSWVVVLAGIACHRVTYGFVLLAGFGASLAGATILRRSAQGGDRHSAVWGLVRAVVIIVIGVVLSASGWLASARPGIVSASS